MAPDNSAAGPLAGSAKVGGASSAGCGTLTGTMTSCTAESASILTLCCELWVARSDLDANVTIASLSKHLFLY